VAVLNALTPGSSPTYTPLDGVTDLVTREYQLCFKCHSGATTLTSNAGLKPSQYALDKGVEFNPANPSFHPIEAAGKNQSAAMTESLAGTSPYKRWNFNTTSTVRCLNCHAGATGPEALPGSAMAPHTSSNRGILLENYRDRVLKPRDNVIVDGVVVDKAAYNAGDFALCYVCHGEEPFLDNESTATNFPAHALHLSELSEEGDGGTDIDKAGDGQGNAICAECHFRTHSTTSKVGEPGGSRLVKFAPNVEPLASGGTPSWTLGADGGGSCALTCHGEKHDGYNYND
jgi:Doubled CXXCH motif (Paired_CXXCH_1)